MAEKLVPLLKDGQPVAIAITPRDFFRKKIVPKDEFRHEFTTYAEAGYHLSDRYEDLTEYDGPKTQRQHEREQEERRAARSAPKAEAAADEAKPPAKREPKTGD